MLVALAAVLAAAPAPDLDAFEDTLGQHDSATKALEQWCALRQIADPPRVRATNLGAAGNDPPPDVRRRLAITKEDRIALRHVRLSCGGTALSIAWNWYVPARLTASMRETLRTTDTPFGKAVAALNFRREPLETIPGRGENCPAGTISAHQARLVLPDGKPLAFMIECYTAANLDR